VSLLSEVIILEIEPMVAAEADDPEEAMVPEAEERVKFVESPYEDSSTAIVRRRTYARLTVSSLDAVCRCYTRGRELP